MAEYLEPLFLNQRSYNLIHKDYKQALIRPYTSDFNWCCQNVEEKKWSVKLVEDISHKVASIKSKLS